MLGSNEYRKVILNDDSSLKENNTSRQTSKFDSNPSFYKDLTFSKFMNVIQHYKDDMSRLNVLDFNRVRTIIEANNEKIVSLEKEIAVLELLIE